jgi:hypothetical protein
MKLGDFQDAFARALLAPDADPSRYPVPLAQLMRRPAFAVHRNTVTKGCIDALQANYPTVSRLVGEEWFRAAATVFVRAHPPRVPMLVAYREGFTDFLETFPPAAELPYLPGVARADRFWTEVHVAADQAPLAAGEVAALPLETLAAAVLEPHAAVRWAWFAEHPVATLWRRNRGEENGSDRLDWRGEGLLVARPRAAVESRRIDAAACAFLDACARGETVARAAAAALAADSGADLAALMKTLLEAGAFGGLRIGQEAKEHDT